MTASKANEQTSTTPSIPVWQDILGRWVERAPNLWLRLGEWETRLLEDQLRDCKIRQPIYIAGLARAGSTILLELLSRHPDMVTHRYRDFPLLATPWAWNWFVDKAGSEDSEARERAHRDGIAVTPDSPEAFEEMIWMAFFPWLHDPGQQTVLGRDQEAPRFEAFYRAHLRKLLQLRGGERYLAKGNYNVTRLAYLLKLFPDARFVVPVRDPLWHIASLEKQHRLFCEEERRDPRVLRHMRRAGHFEFGLDRRPANTGDPLCQEIDRCWTEGEEVQGWALYWSLIYGHVLQQLERDPALRAATLIVRYEDFCNRPEETLSAILEHCSLSPQDLPEEAARRVRHPRYYRPQFTPDQQGTIREITREVAEHFGYPEAASSA